MEEKIRELTDLELLTELKEWYSSKELSKFLDTTEQTISNFLTGDSKFAKTNSTKLRQFFLKHVQENSKFEMIKDVYTDWETNGSSYMVDTPDGFQYVSRFVNKEPRMCFDIRAVNFHLNCSGDHLIETNNGWVKTEDLKIGDKILTKVGFEQLTYKEAIGEREVFDMTVEHPNHRYWGGAGISSHNSGKSYDIARAIVEAQKEGYMCVLLDSEQALSQDYLEKIGVNFDEDKIMTVQVSTVEQTQDMMIEVLTSVREEQERLGNNDKLKLFLVVDSLGFLSSAKAMNNAESGHHAADMGTKAKALTNMITQVIQKIGATDTVCIMTNHGAMEVGVMYPTMKPKGGAVMEYSPSISLRVTKGKLKAANLDEFTHLYGESIPKELDALGIVQKIELYKSRFTRPFRKVQLMIPYDFGLPEHAGLFDYLRANQIIEDGSRKGYYQFGLQPFDKEFTRKDFIKGGWADTIMEYLLAEEKKGKSFNFIMKDEEDELREQEESSSKKKKKKDIEISEEIDESKGE